MHQALGLISTTSTSGSWEEIETDAHPFRIAFKLHRFCAMLGNSDLIVRSNLADCMKFSNWVSLESMHDDIVCLALRTSRPYIPANAVWTLHGVTDQFMQMYCGSRHWESWKQSLNVTDCTWSVEHDMKETGKTKPQEQAQCCSSRLTVLTLQRSSVMVFRGLTWLSWILLHRQLRSKRVIHLADLRFRCSPEADNIS